MCMQDIQSVGSRCHGLEIDVASASGTLSIDEIMGQQDDELRSSSTLVECSREDCR
jgi:hypothetical protein